MIKRGRLIKNKRGQSMPLERVPDWLIYLFAAVILFIAIGILVVKGGSAIDYIKKLFGFG